MKLDLPLLELPGSAAERPLVVLLGLPADLEGSRRLLVRLAAGRPLLAVASLTSTAPTHADPTHADPTHADPTHADPTPSWPALTTWLEERLAERGFDRVDLLGWSFGGAWALQWLARAPERIDRAVLAVTCAHFRARERALLGLLARLLRERIDADVLHRGLLPMLFSAGFLHRPGAFATLAMHLDGLAAPREPWAAQLDNLLAHDLRSALAEMHAVRLVLAGSEDWLFPASEVARLAAGLPRARFEALASGHAVWFEAEDAFVEAVHRAFDRGE